MDERRLKVLQRRHELQMKIAAQRRALAEIEENWQPVMQLADQAVVGVRFMRSHPVLIAAVAGLVVVRRRGVSGLVKGIWRAWKAWRYVSEISGKVSARMPQ